MKLIAKECRANGCNTITRNVTGFCAKHGHLVESHVSHAPGRYVHYVDNSTAMAEEVRSSIPYPTSTSTRKI